MDSTQPIKLEDEPVTEEAKAAFAYTCNYYLQMRPEEFLRRYDAGEFRESTETRVQRVISMLPFAR